ncbi:zinc-ribbon domain-containing protein, partial [bacterium]|nr:zinc-ribbon domain-containing protein [bacterium]
MILSCNSCEKKFVVPDQAITAAGRTVQCGSCGNRWKQYPIKSEISEVTSYKKINNKKLSQPPKLAKNRKKKTKKTRDINLYSPEYLEKKHGIKLNDVKRSVSTNPNKKVS